MKEIIKSYEFSCRSSADAVVFRAEMKHYSYAEEYNASDFVEIISSWVENDASIVVDDSRLSVDPTCPTELESFEARDCVQSPSAASSNNIALVGGIAGALCFILLAAIVTMFLVIVFVVRSKKKKEFPVRYDI